MITRQGKAVSMFLFSAKYVTKCVVRQVNMELNDS